MTKTIPSRGRFVSGVVAGVLMIVSGALHSIAGWPGLKAAMSRTNTPAAVVHGLAVPWHFAGVSMAAFGLLVILDMLGARRGGPSSPPMNRIIGAVYLTFGLIGIVAIKPDPTFAFFVVPGALALVAK